jgi:signal peptidase I
MHVHPSVIAKRAMGNLPYQKIIDHLIREELGNGKKITLRVSGDSMHPLIRQGDSIRIERCAPEVLGIGDIITFKRDGAYYTHRLLRIVTRGSVTRLMTKGDNEVNLDPPVSPDQILGKVAVIWKKNRTLYLKTPFWSFMNRLLGVFSLVETLCIHLYRSAAGRFPHVKILLLPATMKPSSLYHRIKDIGLRFTTGIIA